MQHIPSAYKREFKNGIRHPELYLWDSWSYEESGILHLYCLAVPRKKNDGSLLDSSERNSFPFHIRHFTSKDDGICWKDEGCFLETASEPGTHYSRSVWSGSVERLPNGSKLVAYTGLSQGDAEHNFIQNIALAVSQNGHKVAQIAKTALSSPSRDWQEIVEKGYYLAPKEELGNNNGEEGGPILAWRDPFIFVDKKEQINLFWAAKVGPLKNAMARAVLEKDVDLFKIAKLFPPSTLPNGSEFTQLELPKVVYDEGKGLYYLMISSCNRIFEGQSDAEVDKCVRLYSSTALEGPWVSLGDKILGAENLFGPTVLKTDFENNRLLCIAPYTDAAGEDLKLTFAPPFYVYLDQLRTAPAN